MVETVRVGVGLWFGSREDEKRREKEEEEEEEEEEEGGDAVTFAYPGIAQLRMAGCQCHGPSK